MQKSMDTMESLSKGYGKSSICYQMRPMSIGMGFIICVVFCYHQHMQKVVLITGASSGIGLASVERLVKDGHFVYGSFRKEDDANIVEKAGGIPIQLDITDYSSLESAVSRIISEKQRIDVLFNNAGYGLYGTVEETSIEDAKHQFEVNLFGLARLTQLVLPHMRNQQQ